MDPLELVAAVGIAIAVAGIAVAYRYRGRTVGATADAARRLEALRRTAEMAQHVADEPSGAVTAVLDALRDGGVVDPGVLVYDEPSGRWLRRPPEDDAFPAVPASIAEAADRAWEGGGDAIFPAEVGTVVVRIPSHTGVRAVLVAAGVEGDERIQMVRAAAALLSTSRVTFEPRVERGPATAVPPSAVDSLTGLGTPTAFFGALEQRAQQPRQPLAMLFIAMDGVEEVAAELGWRAGEEALRIGARRLRRCLRPDDVLARVDPAVFGVLLGETVDPEAAVAVGRRALAAVEGPVAVTGGCMHVSGRGALLWDASGGADGGRLLPEAREVLARADGDIAVSIRLGSDGKPHSAVGRTS